MRIQISYGTLTEKMNTLQKSYFAIVIILIISIITFYKTSNSNLESFALNLITEIIGIFITVFLIDWAIKTRERKEKLKILQSAYVQFRSPLYKFFALLINIYKATSEELPSGLHFTYKQTLDRDDFYEKIRLLDFKKQAPILPRIIWATFVNQHILLLKNSFDKIIDKYAFVLDSHIITQMEEISSSRFLQIFSMGEVSILADESMDIDRTHLCMLNHDGAIKDLKAFMKQLFDLIEYFEKQSDIKSFWTYDDSIWKDNIEPKLGSGIVFKS